MIVVQGDNITFRVGDLDEGIVRRTEPPRVDFRDDRFAPFAVHFEDVPVPGTVRPAVDDDRKDYFLSVGRIVVGILGGFLAGFLLQALRQRIERERHVVGNACPVGSGNEVTSRFCIFGGRRERGLFEIPAVRFNLDRLAHAGAQREDARYKGQLTDRDPVGKALAAAV